MIGVWPAAPRQTNRKTPIVVIFRVIDLLGIDAQSSIELVWLRGILAVCHTARQTARTINHTAVEMIFNNVSL